jgi:hypothetical protein
VKKPAPVIPVVPINPVKAPAASVTATPVPTVAVADAQTLLLNMRELLHEVRHLKDEVRQLKDDFRQLSQSLPQPLSLPLDDIFQDTVNPPAVFDHVPVMQDELPPQDALPPQDELLTVFKVPEQVPPPVAEVPEEVPLPVAEIPEEVPAQELLRASLRPLSKQELGKMSVQKLTAALQALGATYAPPKATAVDTLYQLLAAE